MKFAQRISIMYSRLNRNCADYFSPLVYNQQRPLEELVAKDLHGLEWKFYYIYKGQRWRYLLTTGLSAFVNKTKLISGHVVLFVRGGDGQLRLGIQRPAQVKGCTHGSNIEKGFDSINP